MIPHFALHASPIDSDRRWLAAGSGSRRIGRRLSPASLAALDAEGYRQGSGIGGQGGRRRPRRMPAATCCAAHSAGVPKHTEAVADFTKCIELDPRNAAAYNHRGTEQFKLGHIKESLADFDRYLELEPKAAPSHWMRGISLYYVGRFDDGRQQFKAGDQVFANDVENAVWHFLCNAMSWASTRRGRRSSRSARIRACP